MEFPTGSEVLLFLSFLVGITNLVRLDEYRKHKRKI